MQLIVNFDCDLMFGHLSDPPDPTSNISVTLKRGVIIEGKKWSQRANTHSNSHNNNCFEKSKKTQTEDDKQRIQGCLNLFYNFPFLNLYQCVVSAGFFLLFFFEKNNLNKSCITLRNEGAQHVFNSICHLYRKKGQQQQFDHWVLWVLDVGPILSLSEFVRSLIAERCTLNVERIAPKKETVNETKFPNVVLGSD